MKLHRINFSVVLFVVLLAVASCSKDTPVAPTPPVNPNPPPPPAPTLYAVSGVVQQAGNGPGLSATVRVIDGPNAGQTANTDGNGAYTLSGLTFAGFNIEAASPGHVAQLRPAILTAGVTSKTENFALLPSAIWTRSGSGNQVFDMPTYVSRVRIQGRWNRTQTSNFIVHIGGRFVVNEILRQSITYDGTHLTIGGVVEIVSSGQIAWTFTEVR